MCPSNRCHRFHNHHRNRNQHHCLRHSSPFSPSSVSFFLLLFLFMLMPFRVFSSPMRPLFSNQSFSSASPIDDNFIGNFPRQNQQKDGDVFRVFRIFTENWSDVKAIQKLSEIAKENAEQVDFWLESAHPGQFADVMVSPEGMETFQRFLTAYPHLHVELTVDDVQKLIVLNEFQAEGKRQKDARERAGAEEETFLRSRRRDPPPDTDSGHKQFYAFDQIGQLRGVTYPWGQYTGYNEMVRYMRTLEFYYPNLVQLIQLGTTHEGRSIEGVKIGYNGQIFPQPSNSEHKPKNMRRARQKRVFWIDGNMHAREWASGHTALFIINQLIWAYEKDPFITNALNQIDFVIVPCTNPDGFEYSRSSVKPQIRLWRKNRSPEQCSRTIWGGIHCCRGVDLNRNFDFHWAETGSSLNACSNLFAGKKAFSEPEAKAIANFLQDEEIKGRVDAFITLHTYAQLWIHPFSHEYQSFPNDVAKVKSLALRATSRLREVYGINYKVGTGADLLSPASGGSDDWAKQTLGVKFVYLVELRPQLRVSNGFILRQEELVPTAIETFEAIKVIIQGVLVENALPSVPLPAFGTSIKNSSTTSPQKGFSTSVTTDTIGTTTTHNHFPTTVLLPSTTPAEQMTKSTLATTAKEGKREETTNYTFPDKMTTKVIANKTENVTTDRLATTATMATEKVKAENRTSSSELAPSLVSGGDEESQAMERPIFQFKSTEMDRIKWGQMEQQQGMLNNGSKMTKNETKAMPTATIATTTNGTDKAKAMSVSVSNESTTKEIMALTSSITDQTKTTNEADNNATKVELETSTMAMGNGTESAQKGINTQSTEADNGSTTIRQLPLDAASAISVLTLTPTPLTTSTAEQQQLSTSQIHSAQFRFTFPSVPTRRMTTPKTLTTNKLLVTTTTTTTTTTEREHQNGNKSTLTNGKALLEEVKWSTTEASAVATTVLDDGNEHEQRNVQIDEIDASSIVVSTFLPLIRIITAFKLNSDNFTEFDIHRRGEDGTLRNVLVGNKRGKQNGGALGDYWRALFAEHKREEETQLMATTTTTTQMTTETADQQQKCRDERSSCAFWIRAHPLVCTEQMRYMRRNCAFSCNFCPERMKHY